MFAGNFAPAGWMFCEGQLLPISENETLFQLIGTTYGGDGRTTFGLPDLRGRVPVHVGKGNGLTDHRDGEVFGAETVALTANQLPPHTHTLRASLPKAEAPQTPTPAGLVAYDAEPGSTQSSFTTDPSGGGAVPVAITQPSLAIRFIIALEGIYPSRG